MKQEKKLIAKKTATSHTISVLDRLINKPVNVSFPDKAKLVAGDLVVYKDQEKKEYLWEYLWYSIKTEKKWTFVRVLEWKEMDRHIQNKEKADALYQVFKKQFKQKFPDSKPITARIDLHGSQIYFYFFAEDRYDFSDFVRTFREQVRLKFFIYQVSARDRIRMFPGIDTRYDANGLPMMYSIFKHPLPQVSKNAIQSQWLRGRDMERLKDRSGQLDHTLEFEADLYAEEVPKYPEKRSIVTLWDKKMMCTWYNILTQEIKLRGEDPDKPDEFYGEFMSISLEEFEKKWKISGEKVRKKRTHTKNKTVTKSPDQQKNDESSISSPKKKFVKRDDSTKKDQKNTWKTKWIPTNGGSKFRPRWPRPSREYKARVDK